ncbi:hypothetical protein niasHT_019888 [Heterodera trifolii]|uniref:Uncharacterized protein n=1 Tax=Heterodera trifolii TaxID=157864 RepID=A0ABD2KY38_9BILA
MGERQTPSPPTPILADLEEEHMGEEGGNSRRKSGRMKWSEEEEKEGRKWDKLKGRWNAFLGGWHNGGDVANHGAPGDGEAMPSPSIFGGAGIILFGDGDGAYEYPLVDETDAFGGAPGLRHQQGHTFAGYMRGSFEMDGGQMPSPSYPNFGGFGRGGAYGGAGREESPEEWEDEMVGGGGEGRTEMGQIERGGGMPFWMGGTMAAGETTDGTRTDSEEQQRYSQYLETIHQRYGVVPSAAGRSNNAQQQELSRTKDKKAGE